MPTPPFAVAGRTRSAGRTAFALSTLALIAALMLTASVAQAVPALDGQFDVSGVGSDNELVADPNGDIWVTLDSATADIARIRPGDALPVTEFDLPNVSNPIGLTLGPSGDDLWMTQANGVARMPIANPAGTEAFAVAGITEARGLATGPDGNLWAASGDKVVRIPPGDPTNGFEAFQVIVGGRGIAAGSDGHLWAADFGGGRVARVTTAGVATYFDVGGGPYGIGAGPNEQVVYSNAQTDPHTVGRITPGGSPLLTNTPGADPFGVAFGADGAFWIGQFATDNLGRLTPGGAYTTPIAFPAGSGPRQLTAGPGNTLWVALDTAEQVARISGVDPPAPPPPANGDPETTITKGPKGKVRTKGKRAKRVRFAFRSSIANSTFECALRKRGKRKKREKRLAKWSSCTSPRIYRRLRRGRYEFRVRASAEGKTDPTPAKRRFRVVLERR